MSCSADDDDDDQFIVPNISQKTRIKKLIFFSVIRAVQEKLCVKKCTPPRNLQIYLSIFLHV
jgi:hypothetical protein